MNRKYLALGGVILVIIIWAVFPKGKTKQYKVQAEPTTPAAKALYAKAVKLKKSDDAVEARAVYQDILQNHPDTDNIAEIQKELEALNLDIIFSKREVPERTVMHEVVTGDTLGKLAKEYGTTIELIQKCNNLKTDVIRIGQRLRIWTGQFNIYVDKSRNILILKEGNEMIKVYSVSTGEDNSTPVGTFKVATRLQNPVWFKSGVIVPPESPENVLGTRWLGFDLPGYGIHGTIEPETIGQQVTLGCVRMLNEDVEELYSLIPRGVEVKIVD